MIERAIQPAIAAAVIGLTVWAALSARPRPVEGRAAPGVAHVVGSGFPRTLVDSGGTTTVLHSQPRRIASVALVTDEILLDLLPAKRILAVTGLAALPDVSNVVEKASTVPNTVALNVEHLISLKPDLVFVARFTSVDATNLLRGSQIPVYRLGRYESLADIRHNVLFLGEALDARRRAEQIVSEMDETLDSVRKRLQTVKTRPRVLYYSPGGYTSGKGTLFEEILTIAGGRNAAVDAGLVGQGTIATEVAIALDPEVILLAGAIGNESGGAFDPVKQLLQNPAWETTTAARTGRIYVVPTRYIMCISHHVVELAPAVARVLHPGQFEGERN